MTTVQDFFSSNEISGALTPEQAAQLLELPNQGDTVSATEPADAPASAPAQGTTPAPTAEPNTTTTDEATTQAEPTADNAVILAKDGKHVIPFDKLAEARESAQQAAAERDAAVRRAAELQAQLEAAQRQPAAEQAKPAEAVDLQALRDAHYEALQAGDKDEALKLGNQIDAEIQRQAEERALQRMAERTAQQQANAAAEALQRVAADAKARFPALDEASPNANPEAIEFVVWKRDALIAAGQAPEKALAQAVEKADALFRLSNGQAAARAPDPKGAAAAAAAAIAAAKQTTPATLSDIPGGKPAGQSLEVQMASKSGPEMLDVMQNMTRDQIEDFLNRTI